MREEVSWDTESSHPQHTITNLSPYTNVSIKLVLMNPEGRKESQELVVQTDEDGEFLYLHRGGTWPDSINILCKCMFYFH